MTKEQIERMSQEELGRWYEKEVGYNPFVDDPTISVEEVHRIIFSIFEEC